MVKKKERERLLYKGMLVPEPTFLESFKYKQFARNFVLTKGNVSEAYKLTFDSEDSARKMFATANTILERPEVQMELRHLLPSDHDIFAVYRTAIESPVDGRIDWSNKLKAAETMLKVKGHLKPDGSMSSTTNNVVMVIEK